MTEGGLPPRRFARDFPCHHATSRNDRAPSPVTPRRAGNARDRRARQRARHVSSRRAGAHARPARGPARRMDGRRPGGLEPPPPLDQRPPGGVHESGRAGRFQLHEFRPGVSGTLRHPRQFPRLPGLGRDGPGAPGPDAREPVPGHAKRRLGLSPVAVRIGGVPERPHRLRHAGHPGHRERGPAARHPHLRHLGHRAPALCGQRPDVPRLTYPHRGDRSPRHGGRLHLHLRPGASALAQRARGVLLRLPGPGHELGAVPPRRHPGAARRARPGPDREPPADLRRALTSRPPMDRPRWIRRRPRGPPIRRGPPGPSRRRSRAST